MNAFGEQDLPPELEDVASRLRQERSTLTPLELDHLQLRIRARTATQSRPTMTRRSPVKSRFLVTLMLAFGVVFSTTGAGLAVSGLADSGSASEAQYPEVGDSDVLGEVGEVEESTPSATPATPATPAPAQAEPQAAAAPQAAQAPRQLAATGDGDQLPFTGMSAIPVLLLGVALLGSGFLLRRRTKADTL